MKIYYKEYTKKTQQIQSSILVKWKNTWFFPPPPLILNH